MRKSRSGHDAASFSPPCLESPVLHSPLRSKFASLEIQGVRPQHREKSPEAGETFSEIKADLVAALGLQSSGPERHMRIAIIRNVIFLVLKLYEREQPPGAKHYEVYASFRGLELEWRCECSFWGWRGA